MNTVDIFHSLKAHDEYNCLLMLQCPFSCLKLLHFEFFILLDQTTLLQMICPADSSALHHLFTRAFALNI
jgi:hypothetical protein